MKRLYKTTIVIWSETDPSGTMEIDEIASEAIDGQFYCSKQRTIRVDEPTTDPDWDQTSFFDKPDDEED